MRKYIINGTYALLLLAAFTSCKKFLDVVPDNVATIDNAFTMRTQAMKFLFTCYSFMPRNGHLDDDPAMVGGDELWEIPERGAYLDMAKGRVIDNSIHPRKLLEEKDANSNYQRRAQPWFQNLAAIGLILFG